MQKHFYLLFLILLSALLSVPSVSLAQNGCPGCNVSLPALPSDTIYISDAPDGTAGQLYNGDISFRMPKTTTPVNAVDPGTPAGLNINKITIVSVVNVPPGLEWEPSQFEFDPDNETDGCVKFCGTPLQPGFYEIEVFISAEVLLVTQSTSFSFPMYIAPAVSTNDGFSMQNSSGCGEVTVSFDNNIPANGASGYSYLWDFGNGTTSTLENPAPQTYTSPGQYPVSYKATIDTFGYKLTTVQVLSAGCDDFGIPTSVPPDLYIKIKDPNGNLLISTTAVSNVSFPFATNINLFLGNGTYELEVRDDDTFGSESCGYVYFNKNNTDTLVSGDLKVIVNIIHPVSTITSTDTVVVYEKPEPPAIQPGTALEICNGSEIELEINNYTENLQWYKDTTVLFGETDWSLFVNNQGSYWAEYTSPDGCKSVSDVVAVAILPLPAAPAFHATFNELSLNDPALLPNNYSLQWYQDGYIIPGATEEIFCINTPGTLLYTLEVTDHDTGCSNYFSIGVTYAAGYNCATASGELAAMNASLLVYPNPAKSRVTLAFETQGPEEIRLTLTDATGRSVYEADLVLTGGAYSHEIDLAGFNNGFYLLKLQKGSEMVVRKLLKID